MKLKTLRLIAFAAFLFTGALPLHAQGTQGPAAVGTTAKGYPVWFAGTDTGSILRSILTDNTGKILIGNFPTVYPVTGTFWQATQPVSISGTVPISGTVSISSLPSLPTGANTIGNVGINGTVPVSGNVGLTGSPSVSVSNFPGTQPVSGSVSVSNFPATQPISASALPLPTGAATAANQAAPGTAGTPSSQVLSVQGVSGGTPLPISGSITATNPSVGSAASSAPTSATLIGGTDGTNLRGISTDTSGRPNVNINGTVPVTASVLPLPTGAATSAKQAQPGTAGTASVDVLTIQGAVGMTAVKVDGSAVTQPISGNVGITGTPSVSISGTPSVTISGTVTTSASPSSGAPGSTAPASAILHGGTDGTNLRAILTDTGGRQIINVNSLPSIPAGSNAIGSVSVSNFPGTQPVSASTLPLPTGAATSAKQPSIGTAGTASTYLISCAILSNEACAPPYLLSDI